MPILDFLVLSKPNRGRIALNLGGIANVTVLPAGGRLEDVRGFDTGPGNMVLDAVARLVTGGRLSCDADGALAAAGTVDQAWLAELVSNPYFRLPPPKSTGREVFGEHYARACLLQARARGLGPSDVLATLTALTAETVRLALTSFVLGPTAGAFEDLVASGGGVHNASLLGELRRRLGREGLRLRTAEECGLSVDGKEAVAFAVLAYLTLTGRAGNVPGVTGAGRGAVLGCVVPAGSGGCRT